MSYKNSSLYASRVYEEHPLTLWSFDEDITYYSILTEQEKSVTSSDWTLSASATSASVSLPNNPINDSPMRKLYVSGSTSFLSFQLTSAIDDSIENILDDDKGSVCFSAFINIPETTIDNINNIEIGFNINGSASVFTQFNQSLFIQDNWIKIEHTEDLNGVNTFAPYVKINYSQSNLTINNSSISVCGLSCGQWSEQFNSRSSGVSLVPLPTEMSEAAGYGSLHGIEIDAYGLSSQSTAYVIEFDKRILANSSGIPMTYGSKSNISIFPSQDLSVFDEVIDGGGVSPIVLEYIDGGFASSSYTETIHGGHVEYVSEQFQIPSIIFKSNGFLNSTGNYQSLTAEFWMRINPLNTYEKRIMGPLGKLDGLYVDNNNIIIKVGQYKKSYFVGQWYRPMLIHFIQSPNEISLMINGETVIQISINGLDQFDFNSKEKDYIGFFGDTLIPNFDINSFSIFPYKVASEVAKRRFVYGQGVDELENISYSVGSDITYLDFPFAKYSSTISYPKRLWTDGYFNNITVSNEGIEPIAYSLPNIIFTNNSSVLTQAQAEDIWSSFEQDNYEIQSGSNTFIKMLPNSDYNNFDSTIYFTNINTTRSSTPAAIHAILETASGSVGYTEEQSLLYFKNKSTTDYINIRILSGNIEYVFNDEVLESFAVTSSENICVGIKFDDFINTYPQTSVVLSNTDTTSLNFGGYAATTFLGKIYSLTFNDEFCSDIISSSIFNVDGIANKAGFGQMFDYIGSYTLYPLTSNTSVYLDVASFGYWESAYPLTYFGKFINTSAGSLAYDLDMIQFNIDSPTPLYSISSSVSNNYFDNSVLKSFITLQSSASVSQTPYTDFSNTVEIRSNRIVDFDSLSSFDDTKFEICDRTLIYPPKDSVDFNDYHIVLHLEVISRGINTNNIKVKKMSLSSVVYDETSNYKINTPTGRTVEMFATSGSTSLYKQDTPFALSLESSPYLYLAGNSGIENVYSASPSITKAMSFNINETQKSGFVVVGIQFEMMYIKSLTFSGSMQFASLNSDSSNIEYNMYLIPEYDNKRAFIKVFDQLGNEVNDIDFYMNGNVVNKVVVTPLEWISVVMSLPANSEIPSSPGHFDVYPGISINSFAAFDKDRTKDSQIEISDSWQDTVTNYPLWSDVSASSKIWNDIYNPDILSIGNYVNGKNILDSYYGVSSIIGNDSDILSVNFDSINVINDVSWSSFEVSNI